MSLIPFQDGEPVAASDSNTATTDIFANADISKCPDNCFRYIHIRRVLLYVITDSRYLVDQ